MPCLNQVSNKQLSLTILNFLFQPFHIIILIALFKDSFMAKRSVKIYKRIIHLCIFPMFILYFSHFCNLPANAQELCSLRSTVIAVNNRIQTRERRATMKRKRGEQKQKRDWKTFSRTSVSSNSFGSNCDSLDGDTSSVLTVNFN